MGGLSCKAVQVLFYFEVESRFYLDVDKGMPNATLSLLSEVVLWVLLTEAYRKVIARCFGTYTSPPVQWRCGSKTHVGMLST